MHLRDCFSQQMTNGEDCEKMSGGRVHVIRIHLDAQIFPAAHKYCSGAGFQQPAKSSNWTFVLQSTVDPYITRLTYSIILYLQYFPLLSLQVRPTGHFNEVFSTIVRRHRHKPSPLTTTLAQFDKGIGQTPPQDGKDSQNTQKSHLLFP